MPKKNLTSIGFDFAETQLNIGLKKLVDMLLHQCVI